MSVGEMSVGEMSVGEVSVGELSVGEMSGYRVEHREQFTHWHGKAALGRLYTCPPFISWHYDNKLKRTGVEGCFLYSDHLTAPVRPPPPLTWLSPSIHQTSSHSKLDMAIYSDTVPWSTCPMEHRLGNPLPSPSCLSNAFSTWNSVDSNESTLTPDLTQVCPQWCRVCQSQRALFSPPWACV